MLRHDKVREMLEEALVDVLLCVIAIAGGAACGYCVAYQIAKYVGN
jgi:hypothetical protein